MEIIVCILLSLPIFLLIFLQKSRTKPNTPLPPGPPRLPIIGNLNLLNNPAPHRLLWQLCQKYGPVMYLKLGSVPTLVVCSAKMAEVVMKTQDLNFCNRPPMLGQRKLSYNGLDLAFAPYGDYWREMRKICVVHLFHSNRARAFRSIREFEVAHMIQKISKAAENCRPVNLSEALLALSSTITCRIGFGNRYEDEGSERSRFHSLLNETQALFSVFCFSDYFPFMGWADKLTGYEARLEKNFKELDQFYQELIDEHLDPQRQTPEQEDIIDVLIRLRKERSLTVDITWDHIKAILMNIFVAGSDTSAATVVWAMTALIKNPRVMKKVQHEVRNVVGHEQKFVDEDRLEKLPYLKAVVKESLRMDPVGPLLLPRETIQDCNINGYHIPAKTLVFVNAYAIGRDPKVWENPEEFSPDRFIGSSIDFRGQDYGLVPFGAGRRSCPGINLGVAVVELALANLVHNFNWEMPIGSKVEDIDMDVLPGLTKHKKNPLCLMPKNCI